MSPTRCANCKRKNPPGAKFCNACGAQLHLLSCPSCGAGNQVGATTCRQCKAPLSEGKTGSVAVSSTHADALSADAKFDTALQALRERLPMIGTGYAEGPAAHRVEVDAPADELRPELGTTSLTDPSTGQLTTDVVFPSGRPGYRVRRVRPATVVLGTAALAAAGVAVYYAFDHRVRADVSRAPFAAGEPPGKAKSAASSRPVNPDATEFPPVAAPVPRVTHGVAKSAAPTAAAATTPGPSESGAPRPNPSAAQREDRATAVAPAAGASVPPRAVGSGTGIERPPPARIGPCTEAVATLGLCNPEPNQRRE